MPQATPRWPHAFLVGSCTTLRYPDPGIRCEKSEKAKCVHSRSARARWIQQVAYWPTDVADRSLGLCTRHSEDAGMKPVLVFVATTYAFSIVLSLVV
jgi:hypothetical protein